MLKNCELCNRVFAHPTRNLCPECHEKMQGVYQAVKDYLQENPRATVVEVAHKVGVDVELIYEYIREGRLGIVPKDVKFFCEICGAEISSGRICAKCRAELSKGRPKPAPEPEEQKSGTRVHYLDQIKKRR